MMDPRINTGIFRCEGILVDEKAYSSAGVVQPFVGAKNIPRDWKEAGQQTVAISRMTREDVTKILDELGVLASFDRIVALGDQGGVTSLKDLYAELPSAMNTEVSECIVFESLRDGVHDARNSLLKIIGVKNGSEEDLTSADAIADSTEICLHIHHSVNRSPEDLQAHIRELQESFYAPYVPHDSLAGHYGAMPFPSDAAKKRFMGSALPLLKLLDSGQYPLQCDDVESGAEEVMRPILDELDQVEFITPREAYERYISSQEGKRLTVFCNHLFYRYRDQTGASMTRGVADGSIDYFNENVRTNADFTDRFWENFRTNFVHGDRFFDRYEHLVEVVIKGSLYWLLTYFRGLCCKGIEDEIGPLEEVMELVKYAVPALQHGGTFVFIKPDSQPT